MVSQAQGGRLGSVFSKTTLMGRVSTQQNQTPTQCRRKRTSQPSNDSTRSQRRRLCSDTPFDVPSARVPLMARLLNHEINGNNHQLRRRKRIGLPPRGVTRVHRRKVFSASITLIQTRTPIDAIWTYTKPPISHLENMQMATGTTPDGHC